MAKCLLGVANFCFNYLKHFSIHFKKFLCLACCKFHEFSDIPQHEGSYALKSQKWEIRKYANPEISPFLRKPTVSETDFGPFLFFAITPDFST